MSQLSEEGIPKYSGARSDIIRSTKRRVALLPGSKNTLITKYTLILITDTVYTCTWVPTHTCRPQNSPCIYHQHTHGKVSCVHPHLSIFRALALLPRLFTNFYKQCFPITLAFVKTSFNIIICFNIQYWLIGKITIKCPGYRLIKSVL